jgi:asparagine synthase (glutamine-hydrolysing)
MYYSIENRSPFLDKDLVEFAISLPPDYLIRKGFTKPILRDSFAGKISNKILKNSEKRGFNFDLSKIMLNKLNRDQMSIILETKTNPIFEFVNFNSIKKILDKKRFLNSETKFLFSLINSFIFLEKL